jgi:nucleotide-binding universal stress UspA family protein
MTTTTPTTTGVTFDRIVVPIDGSDASEAALAYASHLPAKELVLLHVSVDHEVIVPDWILRHDEERQEMSLQESMERLADRLRTPERNVMVDMRIGDVAEEIMAAGREADLIVMMTHGRGAAGRMVFGSVADRVIRHGETPTLVVRVGELTRHPKMPRRVIIALDGSGRAEKAIPGGVKLARACDLPLVLMRSIGLPDVKAELRNRRKPGDTPMTISPTLYEDTLRDVLQEARDYLDRHAEELRAQGCANVSTEVIEGSVPFTLLWAANPDDVLVMTTRGQGGYKRWALGSIAEKMVREAPCPVLLQRGPEDVPEYNR